MWIEIHEGGFPAYPVNAFNRTNVELKLFYAQYQLIPGQAFNRTNVELKYVLKFLKCVS